jgi:hypothetical protein
VGEGDIRVYRLQAPQAAEALESAIQRAIPTVHDGEPKERSDVERVVSQDLLVGGPRGSIIAAAKGVVSRRGLGGVRFPGREERARDYDVADHHSAQVARRAA